jgi:hypothetical protein
MKRNFLLTLRQMDRRHIQLALLVLTLTLFVLGAGAPSADGGW